jgi:hypothetical protein
VEEEEVEAGVEEGGDGVNTALEVSAGDEEADDLKGGVESRVSGPSRMINGLRKAIIAIPRQMALYPAV